MAKRLYFFSVIFLLTLMAVPTEARELYFGIKGGLNRANVSDKNYDYWNAVSGFHGGGFVTWTFLDSVQIRTEFNFTTRGTQVSESSITGNVRADYFEIALLASLVPRDNSRLRVLIGPSFAQFLGGTYEFTTEFEGFLSGSGALESDDLNPWDTGIVFGLDYIRSHVVFDLRYTWGLDNVMNQDKYPPEDTPFSLKHRILQFGVGVRI
ncbi:MAG: hypothetical protein MAGBODY4_00936 [Candidatus Marinimicrobia bacterium]|nr:hypothetical protein [Candidatus Neomarinimicrobiota bacterium]